MKLIYSLGRRGFFSEITNMALAMIYARQKGWEFVANCKYWNCRYNGGLIDYFNNSLKESNSLLSAQMTRTGANKRLRPLSLHSWFYLGCDCFNFLYKKLHPDTVYGAEIYPVLRTEEFRCQIDVNEFLSTLKQVLVPNKELAQKIDNFKREIAIGTEYLGVHIRRGDKITTGEMAPIPLEKYVEGIRQSGIKNLYIATDDISAVHFVQEKLGKEYTVHYNPALTGSGFKEGDFNKMGAPRRREETEILLLDIFMLFGASKFIGTFSSNLSRVVPCAIDLEKCISLDEEWSIR